jgi:hypothetical protein
MITMKESSCPVTIALCIPGQWSRPRELIERLPDGYRLTREARVLPDGTQVEFGAAPANNQTAQIFRSSSRLPAAEVEPATVNGYSVNIFLSGPGGSLEAVRKILAAASPRDAEYDNGNVSWAEGYPK